MVTVAWRRNLFSGKPTSVPDRLEARRSLVAQASTNSRDTDFP